MIFMTACDINGMTYHRLSASDERLPERFFNYVNSSLNMFRQYTEDSEPHVHIYTKLVTEKQADKLEVDIFLHSLEHGESTPS